MLMKGFIKRTMALWCMAGAAVALSGCGSCGGGSGCGGGVFDRHLCDCYDNCWPDRYNYQAAQSVLHTFGAQVMNGHILDQTVWTYHFEPGTAILTRGGLDHLAELARRRPAADPHIFLQTAQDVPYDPNNPEKLVEERSRLNEERRVAILRYLNAETAGRPVAFDVSVHDPSPVGMPAPPAAISIRSNYASFRGTLYGIGAVGGAAPVAPSTPQ
jgi:hypothetical protein